MADFTTSLTITLPTGVTAAKFRDAIAREYHYQDFLPDEVTPNPVSKVNHIKNKICEGLVNAFEADAVKVAAQAVRDANEAAREDFVVT